MVRICAVHLSYMGHLWAEEVYLLLKKKGYISVTP